MKKATLVLIAILALPLVRANADPPPYVPDGTVRLDSLFCFRITDWCGVLGDADRWKVEFELVNWTGKDVHHILVILNTGDHGPGQEAYAPRISGASVDADGRPLAGVASPPAGNLPTVNDWSVSGQTETRVCFGDGSPIVHPTYDGTSNGVPTTFHGLFDPALAAPTTEAERTEAVLAMIPGAINKGGGPPRLGPADAETADDGANVLDGFVLEIDDLDRYQDVSFNWYLLDADGAPIGIFGATGSVSGDPMGFGTWNFRVSPQAQPSRTPTRYSDVTTGVRPGSQSQVTAAGFLNIRSAKPIFFQNSGYDPSSNAPNPNDSSLNWAEDETAGVDLYPINPIPAGKPGEGFIGAVEFGASVTAQFADADDRFIEACVSGLAGGVEAGVNMFVDPSGDLGCQGIDGVNVLRVNGRSGVGENFRVDVAVDGPISFRIERPTAGGAGKYFVHLYEGVPSPDSITVLPKQLGEFCFPALIGDGLDPVAVWNNIGKESLVGSSEYFGTTISNPPVAPTTFFADADGDIGNLPLGSTWTLQGIIQNPDGTSPKKLSVTNAIMIRVR